MDNFNKKYYLDDIQIYSENMNKLKDYICNILEKNTYPLQIITLNIDFLRIANIDNEFKEICKNSHIVLPDGIGIIYLLKLKYQLNIKRITGNDILNIIVNTLHNNHLKIAFLGSSHLNLIKIKNKIEESKLNIKVTDIISPPINFEKDAKINDEIISNLQRSKPDIIFVALGCPRQEKWINNYKNVIGFKIGIGVGAALDFYTGSKKRSPVIFQRLGIEWVWRLISEPKRLFKRYIILDLPFFIKKTIQIKNKK